MPITIVVPQLADLIIEDVTVKEEAVTIEARIAGMVASCPTCGGESRRVHSRYRRAIADMPIAGCRTAIRLLVRRFRCAEPACPRATFAEQVPRLVAPHARRSLALRALHARLGLALGGRAGMRLSHPLQLPVGRMTILRAVRALPDPPAPTPRVLGVDDFALARGRRYGTILIDLETRRPLDVLADRTAETFAAWLKARPGIEIICRDRGGNYAEGARQGAPSATQVADRFHLMQNLATALERLVVRLHPTLQEVAGEEPPPEMAAAPSDAAPAPAKSPVTRAVGRLAASQRSRHAAVQALVAGGLSVSAIARLLHLDRKTVRRYARSETPPEAGRPARRRSRLDPYLAHLTRRWDEGCRNAALLWREVRAQGYRGSATTVRAALAPLRDRPLPPPARRPLAVRTLVGLLVRRPADLPERDQQRLDALLARSDELAGAYCLARGFATLLHERRGADLDGWIAEVTTDGSRELRAFAESLERDRAAVVAGLTQEWSSGPVEGHVNRVKMVKRQMFGRAKLDLLRRRVLLTG